MRKISSYEAGTMRDTQISTLNDLCSVITYTITTDDYGDVVVSGVTISGIPCGVSYVGKFEGRNEENGYTAVDYDAIIRLPLTVIVAIDSEITVLDKQDTAINKTYKLMGFPQIGPSAQNINVKEVTN